MKWRDDFPFGLQNVDCAREIVARKTFIMKDEDDFSLRRQHLIRISFGMQRDHEFASRGDT